MLLLLVLSIQLTKIMFRNLLLQQVKPLMTDRAARTAAAAGGVEVCLYTVKYEWVLQCPPAHHDTITARFVQQAQG
jgi:hypothetical protein